jgi:hypothetical protein
MDWNVSAIGEDELVKFDFDLTGGCEVHVKNAESSFLRGDPFDIGDSAVDLCARRNDKVVECIDWLGKPAV